MESHKLLQLLCLCVGLSSLNLNAEAYISPHYNRSTNELLSHVDHKSAPSYLFPAGQYSNSISQSGDSSSGEKVQKTPESAGPFGNSGRLLRIRKSLRPSVPQSAALILEHERPWQQRQERQSRRLRNHRSSIPPVQEPVMDLGKNSEEDILRLLMLIDAKEGVNLFPGKSGLSYLPSAVPITAPVGYEEDSDEEDDGAIDLTYFGSDLKFHPRTELTGSRKKQNHASRQPSRTHDNDEDNGWIDIYSHKMNRRSGRLLHSHSRPSLSSKLFLKQLFPVVGSDVVVVAADDSNAEDEIEEYEDDDNVARGLKKIASSPRHDMYSLGQLLSPSQDFQSDVPLLRRSIL